MKFKFLVHLILFLGLLSSWLVIGLIVLVISLPYNSANSLVNEEHKTFVRSFLPEGFSFFTRDPREPQILLYDAQTLIPLEVHINAPAYGFGLSRYPRALNVEITMVWKALQDKNWIKCESGKLECIQNADDTPLYIISNQFVKPMLLGDYIVVVAEPIPWAWAKSFKSSVKIMPYKYLKLRIM